jgi:4-diphosphocytidyl-2-C-methyl-D-erythritol kinase
MLYRETPSGLQIFAPAKLNLFFEVLGKREDGFHNVETLVCPITLYDTLSISDAADDSLELKCEVKPCFARSEGASVGDVPTGPENLAIRALQRLKDTLGIRRGARLRLVKRIPSEAGLGGGSSDAAAALVGANHIWNLQLTTDQLSHHAAQLGSDVPLFLFDGPSIGRGRGEIIEPIRWQTPLYLVLVRPPVGLSTAAVYGACRPARQPRSVQPLCDALCAGNLQEAGELMFNRLGAAADSLSPWMARCRAAFAATDCLGYEMTGSGSCFYGLCQEADHAQRVASVLRTEGNWAARVVRGHVPRT